ncbi:PDZ domain-containing protein [Paludisphaera sp.]|uniref:PDZ domain-containing protein n=1 Tax=Paludisphaera sp. TaxID=2017432 RepID=UPI00301D9958
MRLLHTLPILTALLPTLAGIGDAPALGREAQPPLRGVKLILAIDARSNLAGLRQMSAGLSTMEVVMRMCGIPAESIKIDPDDVTPESMLNAVRATRVDADEALLFYYVGHGATDRRYGHFLSPRGGQRKDLLRSRLRDEVLRKRAGLSIILTDCCSSSGTANYKVAGAPQFLEEFVEFMKDLFLRSRGLVDITAATYDPSSETGEYGWFHPASGGIFTSAMERSIFLNTGVNRRLLDTDGDGQVGWAEIFPLIVRDTERGFADYKRDVAAGRVRLTPDEATELARQQTQRPQAFSLGDVEQPRPVGRRGEFGAWIADNYGFGIVIVAVAPGSPASRIESLNGRATGGSGEFIPGDTIFEANGRRISNVSDFLSTLADVGPGGRLAVSGYDASTSWQTTYRAEVILR